MAAVTRTEKVIVITSYTLELTKEEHAYLKDLMGRQTGGGISYAIYEALAYPDAAPAEPDTFKPNDKVTVLPGARSASGNALNWDGPAVVGFGPDSDGDYFIRPEDGQYDDYILPQYLTRR